MNRRGLLTGSVALGLACSAKAAPAMPVIGVVPVESRLSALSTQLKHLPRRRDFSNLPRILDHPDMWDDAAFDTLCAYSGIQKMIGLGESLNGLWPVQAQNLLNSEIISFGHPDALLVVGLYGEAQLALYDRDAWSRFGLDRLVSSERRVAPLQRKSMLGAQNHHDEAGVYDEAGRGIPTLQARGAVFMACHNAVWTHAGRLVSLGGATGSMVQERLAAELTNHIDQRAIVIPSVLGAMAELQRAGFSRIF